MLALRRLEAVGVNIPEIVQLALAATLVPHVFVCEKSAALAPEIEMERLSVEAPVLVRVTVCEVLEVPSDTLPKLSDVVLSETIGRPTAAFTT